MKRLMISIYSVGSYAVGLGSLVYMMRWLANFMVPQAIDSAATSPFGRALLINVALFAMFATQHSIMARPRLKAWLTRFIPESAERSTYVLFSGMAMMLCWQPMGLHVWDVQQTAGRMTLYGLYALAWMILVGSTFVLNHFDLFGLRQVWLEFRKRPYTNLEFATPGPYRIVRHPIYVGWIALAWAAPTMSVAHLAFAVATTAYILIAIQLEERDLLEFHGEAYAEYRRRTPMLIPGLVPSDDEQAAGMPQRST